MAARTLDRDHTNESNARKQAMALSQQKTAAITADTSREYTDKQLENQNDYLKKMQFYNGFKPAIDELQQYYDLYTGEDTDYMCKRKLKDLGIDVEQLPEVLPMEYEVK